MSNCPSCGQQVPDTKLGQMVRQLRLRSDLSLRDASEAWGIPFTTISRIESGQIPNGKHLATLVGILGLSGDEVARLFDDVADPVIP